MAGRGLGLADFARAVAGLNRLVPRIENPSAVFAVEISTTRLVEYLAVCIAVIDVLLGFERIDHDGERSRHENE